MVRGTFANVRIRNRLAPGTEGGCTMYLPTGEVISIYEASQRYLRDDVPLLVLAGKDYGSGSSRDWAAKGPRLQGVRAVIAESFERIHRSNLVGMGVLPLQFVDGTSIASLGLTGREEFDITGITAGLASAFGQSRRLAVRARREDGSAIEFEVSARIETPQEVLYMRHGGILQYVLRQLLGERTEHVPVPARKPHPLPIADHDGEVDEGSIQSFPASDPVSYTGSMKL
jgi:aconitate hydratase A / 2-methylisocitrate dehydratase